MNYSFYGGPKGTSFILETSFTSTDEMKAAFKKGSQYTDVKYGDYVLIDTVNKNDEDNGKLYKRGEDFTNDWGGAIYVAQIVGPSGESPDIQLSSYDDVVEKYNNPGEGNIIRSYVPGEFTGSSLVPGDDANNQSIKWVSCAISDEHGRSTIAYLGFTFPYLVTDFTTSSISAYETTSITRIDDKTKPFYEKWNITIPKGIKGDALKNFRVITAASGDGVQSYTNQSDDRTNSRQILVYDEYDYTSSATGSMKTYYVGDYNKINDISIDTAGTVTIKYSHDDNDVFTNAIKWITSMSITEKGLVTVKYNYGSDYTTTLKWLSKMSLANDGTITYTDNTGTTSTDDTKITWISEASLTDAGALSIKFNNNDTVANISKNLKWITEVNLDAATGTFKITYNDGTNYTKDGLKWIKDISLADDGTITYTDNTGTTSTDDTKLKWIKNIELSDSGVLSVTFNNDTTETLQDQIKWIDSISLDNDGNFIASYTDGTSNTASLAWIDDVSLSTDGKLTFYYSGNNKSELELSQPITWITNASLDTETGNFKVDFNNNTDVDNINKNLTWPINLSINTKLPEDPEGTEGTGNQKLHVTYTTDSTGVDIGNPINYIIKAKIQDNYLYAYYSDPDKRGTEVVDGTTGWTQLGAVKDYDGIYIGKNYTLSDLSLTSEATRSDIVTKLNSLYPTGITSSEPDCEGKVITVGDETASKQFYAFDYAKKSWTYLGAVTSGTDYAPYGAICCRDSDATKSLRENLTTNSVWLIIED